MSTMTRLSEADACNQYLTDWFFQGLDPDNWLEHDEYHDNLVITQCEHTVTNRNFDFLFRGLCALEPSEYDILKNL